MTRTGDRPNYQLPNQRFDKGDAYRLTRLLEESATRFTGGVFGQTWGCLSAPQATLRTVVGPPAEVYLDIGACLFVRSSPDGFINAIDNDTGPWDGKVVIHDPLRSAQATSAIDVTAFAPTSYGGGGGVNGAKAWLVFRRQESEVEVDDKAYWNTGAGVEATAPTNLVVQEYVEFAAVSTIPSGSSTYSVTNGWYRFAYIASWDDPAGPTIVPIHWVHAPYLQQVTPPAYTGSQFAIAPTQATSLDSGGTRGFAPDLGMPSVSKLLHWMLAKLSQHYSTASIIDSATGYFQQYDSGDGWMATPPRGLVEVDADLTVVEDALPPISSALTALQVAIQARPMLLQVVTYNHVTGSYTKAVTDAEAGVIVSASYSSLTHSFAVNGSYSSVFDPTEFICVTGEPVVTAAFSGTDIPRSVLIGVPSTTLPVNLALVSSFTFDARMVTPAGAGVNESCAFFFYGRRV